MRQRRRDRGHGDDRSATRGHHRGARVLDAEERAGEVRVHARLPLLERHHRQRPARAGARRQHRKVQPAERARRDLDGAHDVVFRCDVALRVGGALTQLGRRCLDDRLAAARQRHVCPVGMQRSRARQPDPRAAAE